MLVQTPKASAVKDEERRCKMEKTPTEAADPAKEYINKIAKAAEGAGLKAVVLDGAREVRLTQVGGRQARNEVIWLKYKSDPGYWAWYWSTGYEIAPAHHVELIIDAVAATFAQAKGAM